MNRENGFSLLELVVSLAILSTGLLALAGVFPLVMQSASRSSPAVIAREKAREAVESVHTARDIGELSWPTIRNVAAGGVFVDGETALTSAGEDGLVNTADDGPVEALHMPGDVIIPLDGYRRRIVITDVPANSGGGTHPAVRQVTVTVRYRVHSDWCTYTLVTFVSKYS